MDYRSARRHHQLRARLSAVLRVDRLRAARPSAAWRGLRRAQEGMFVAQRGHGARLNGKTDSRQRDADPRRRAACTGFPYDRRERRRFYLSFWEAFMMRTQGVRRTGSAALDLAYVACGRIDGFWEFGLRAVGRGRRRADRRGGWRTRDQHGRFSAGFRGAQHPRDQRQVASRDARDNRKSLAGGGSTSNRRPRRPLTSAISYLAIVRDFAHNFAKCG